MLRQLIVKNQYGMRVDTLRVIALLFISFVFCVMVIITIVRFGTGFPVAAMTFLSVAVGFFVEAFRESLQVLDRWLTIHDAIEADDYTQFYEGVSQDT